MEGNARIWFTPKQKADSGSAGRAVNVWPTSHGRLREGTRAASIGSWLSMVESLQHHVGELW